MSFLGNTGETETPTSGSAVRVPTWPGAVGLVSGALSVLVAFLARHDVPPLAAGYVLGAMFTPALAVVHRYYVEARRKDPWFVGRARLGSLVTVMVVLGLSAGLINAWLLATELAKT
jgi:hypothetical protein